MSVVVVVVLVVVVWSWKIWNSRKKRSAWSVCNASDKSADFRPRRGLRPI